MRLCANPNLEEFVVAPGWVDLLELLRQVIVFPHEDCVHRQ